MKKCYIVVRKSFDGEYKTSAFYKLDDARKLVKNEVDKFIRKYCLIGYEPVVIDDGDTCQTVYVVGTDFYKSLQIVPSYVR